MIENDIKSIENKCLAIKRAFKYVQEVQWHNFQFSYRDVFTEDEIVADEQYETVVTYLNRLTSKNCKKTIPKTKGELLKLLYTVHTNVFGRGFLVSPEKRQLGTGKERVSYQVVTFDEGVFDDMKRLHWLKIGTFPSLQGDSELFARMPQEMLSGQKERLEQIKARKKHFIQVMDRLKSSAEWYIPDHLQVDSFPYSQVLQGIRPDKIKLPCECEHDRMREWVGSQTDFESEDDARWAYFMLKFVHQDPQTDRPRLINRAFVCGDCECRLDEGWSERV